MALDQQHWQDRLDALADKHGVVGASLAIRHGDATSAAATGVLNLRTQQPATPDSLFQIGSISKLITALLVHQFAAEGRFALTDPIARLLPTVPVPEAAGITVQQLLDRLRDGTHSRAARRDRRHPTERLQALCERARVAVNIAIEARERHKRQSDG